MCRRQSAFRQGRPLDFVHVTGIAEPATPLPCYPFGTVCQRGLVLPANRLATLVHDQKHRVPAFMSMMSRWRLPACQAISLTWGQTPAGARARITKTLVLSW